MVDPLTPKQNALMYASLARENIIWNYRFAPTERSRRLEELDREVYQHIRRIEEL